MVQLPLVLVTDRDTIVARCKAMLTTLRSSLPKVPKQYRGERRKIDAAQQERR